MAARRRRKQEPAEGRTQSIDREGRGIVVREAGPEIHVLGALADETVRYLRVGRRGPEQAALCLEVLEPSPRRVTPPCAHAELCGGCSLQHMSLEDQRAHKLAVLQADLAEHEVAPERWLETIAGASEGYRRRARLGLRWVAKKERVLVGFREKRDPRFVADLEGCPVLAGELGALIPALSELVAATSLRDKLPQIELAVGESSRVMVFRVLEAPTEADRELLRAFGRVHGVRIDLQTGGLDTVAPMDGEDPFSSYRVDGGAIELSFLPTDFVQVNAEINELIIARVMEELRLERGHSVLDLFCGLGNFTLPLARRVDSVLGIEGDEALVARARSNAERNGLGHARFERQDLYRDPAAGAWAKQRFDRVLLDPPRSGAEAALASVVATGAERIVYVACAPNTLARDLGQLVHVHGYVLEAAGIADMFPHTAHVESIAVLRRA